MSLLEKRIEQNIRRWAIYNKFLVEKVKFASNGYPDRIFISPMGIHVWMEIKRPGEKPEPVQYHRLKQLRSRGVLAGWTDTYEHAIALLDAVLVTERLSTPCNSNDVISGICRTLFRSGAGQDIYRIGGVQNSEEAGLR